MVPRSTIKPWLELLAALILIALGMGGVLLAMQSRPYLGLPATDLTPAQVLLRVGVSPNVPAIGLVMLSIGLGTIGLAWFGVKLIHWRFFAPIDARRVWRESIFIALFVMSSAWLQMNRALSLPLAAAILIALALVEVFLNIRGS